MLRRMLITLSGVVLLGAGALAQTPNAGQGGFEIRTFISVAAAGAGTAGRAVRDRLLRLLSHPDDVLSLDDLAAHRQGRARNARARAPHREPAAVTAGHFIFIPSVLLVGVVIGWILGSRAARDAYAMELRRREERAEKKARQGG